LADLNEYLNRYPKDDRAILLRAQTYRKLDLLCEAIEDFTVVIARNPNDSILYEQRAACYAAIGDETSAMADYRPAEKLKSPSPVALNNRAWLLVAHATAAPADLVQGLDLAQRAAAVEPNNPVFQNTLGVAQYRNNRFDEAIESLTKSLAGPNRDADAFNLYFLAMCHYRLGQLPKAKDFFQRADAARQVPGLKPEYVAELAEFHAEAKVLVE
jgi:Flp pilus assembly protein TadD